MPDEKQASPGTQTTGEAAMRDTEQNANVAASIRRLEDFTRAAADWVWETDRHHNYQFLSSGFTRTLGVPAQLLVGGYVFQLTHFSKIDESIMATVNDMREHRPFRNRLVQVSGQQSADHKVLLCGIPVYQETSGAFAGYRGTALDITDRAAANAAFPEDLGRIQDLSDLAADWFWEADGQFQITWLSEGYGNATGLSLPESLGRDLRGLWFGGQSDRSPILPTRTIFRHWPTSMSVADTGETARHLISGKPIFGSAGKLEGYRGLGIRLPRDVGVEGVARGTGAVESVRPESEPKDQTAADQVDAVSGPEIESRPAADIAIPAFVEKASSAPRDEANDAIEASTTLPESGTTPANRDVSAVADIAEAIEATVDLIQDEVEKAGVDLEIRVDDLVPCLRIEKSALQQILLSLTSNAVEHALPRGRVLLSADTNQSGALAIEVGVTKGDGERVLPKNVTPLAPTASADAGKREKTLLGMTKARSLIELHGGDLRFVSGAEGGARAIAEFPADRVVQEHEDPDTWKIIF